MVTVQESMQLDREDWCWLAGLFEGEGTAGNYPASDKRRGRVTRLRIVMTLAQKERAMLDEARRITGVGSVHYQKNWEGFMWVCASRAARVTLTKIYPYLRSPRRKLQVAHALVTDERVRTEAKTAQKLHLQMVGRLRNITTGRFNAKVS